MFVSNVKNLLGTIGSFTTKNAPTLLMTLGIGGLLTGTVIACCETPKALELIEEKKATKVDGKLTVVEKVVAVAPAYWKAGVIDLASVVCIIYANNISLKRQAAALAAYSLSENKFKEYKEAVIKTVGEKKEKEVEDKVAEDQVRNNPLKDRAVIIANGDTLCYDSVSGRYFKSSIEKVRQAVNELNNVLLTEGDATLNEFYDQLNLPSTSIGDEMGWSHRATNELLDVHFSSQLTEDGQPCLVLNYDVAPGYLKYDF